MLDKRSCWTKAFSLFHILLWSNMHNSPTWLGPTWPHKFSKKMVCWPKNEFFRTFFDENWDFLIYCQKKFLGRSFFVFDENLVFSSSDTSIQWTVHTSVENFTPVAQTQKTFGEHRSDANLLHCLVNESSMIFWCDIWSLYDSGRIRDFWEFSHN